MKVVSVRTMRDLDRRTIEAGTPGEILMERAGTGAFYELLAYVELLDSRHAIQFLVLTGKGNNGGDGYVVARLIEEHTDYPVTVCSTCELDELSGDALLNAERLPADIPFEVVNELPDELLVPGTVIVDALLGTGIVGDVREPYATIIGQVNAAGLPVVAIDIPSGINGDDGTMGNAAIEADLTVTMGLPKTGLFLDAGLEHSGRLRVIDIGIPAQFTDAALGPFNGIFAADVRPFLRRLPKTAHKGTMGRIAVVGGSRRYPGAPVLAGRGAIRAGGGLVTLATPASIGPLLRLPLNSLILEPLDDDGTGCHRADAPGLDAFAAAQDVLVVGPGLSREPAALDTAVQLLRSDRPMVLDADGLLAVGRQPDLFPRQATTVLTPHPGEMRRLLTALDLDDLADADRLVQAGAVAQQLGAIVVLKGAATVIAAPDGTITVNGSGCPGLATGGSGDVLSGIIGAFLVHGEPLAAVQAAVFLHGLAGELAPGGQRQLVADDLPELLGEAMQLVSPFA